MNPAYNPNSKISRFFSYISSWWTYIKANELQDASMTSAWRLRDTTERPPRNHQETTGTTEIPPRYYRDTTETPPRHGTTKTPQRHQDTIKAPLRNHCMRHNQRPPRDHGDTTAGTPQQDASMIPARHNRRTNKRPRQYHRDTAETPPRHHQDTSKALTRHQRNTKETPQDRGPSAFVSSS